MADTAGTGEPTDHGGQRTTFCGNCGGVRSPIDARFCTACGASFDAVPAQPIQGGTSAGPALGGVNDQRGASSPGAGTVPSAAGKRDPTVAGRHVEATTERNGDSTNIAVKTLAGLALTASAVGVVLVIVGLIGVNNYAGGYGPSTIDDSSLYFGFAMLGIALQIWMGLLFFWAWRWEHRAGGTSPVLSPPMSADSLESAPAAASGPTATLVAVAGKDLATVDFEGVIYLLLEHVAAFLGASLTTVVSRSPAHSVRAFRYRERVGGGQEIGMFIKASGIESLVRLYPSAYSQALARVASDLATRPSS